MIMKKLFKNDTDAYFVWFNEMQETILVAVLDKYGILIQEYYTSFMEYVVVPSEGTVYLIKNT